MNYSEAEDYLNEMNVRGIKPGLECIENLCKCLGNPEEKLRFIHVAGTNGKGSTALFMASILKEAGLRVGLYRSPAVFNIRENYCIQNRPITKDDFAQYVDTLKEAALISESQGYPVTRYELETAMAFRYFADKQCDIVILEAGMGGTLDATNIVHNTELAVITSVGMDHMQFLGNTIEQIATNKAGIIKEGCSVISAKLDEVAENVVRNVAKEKACEYFIADATRASHIQYKDGMTRFQYNIECQESEKAADKKSSVKNSATIELQMLGCYQVDNAIVAIKAMEVLQSRGYHINESNITKGLQKTYEGGRFEVIAKKPYFIIDGAHNEPAAKRLRETIVTYFPKKRIIFIMGMLKDKEYDKVIRETYELAEHVITVATPNRQRTMSAYELAQAVGEYHSMVSQADSLEEAVELSYLLADKETIIIAFGSLSYLGAISKIVKDREKTRTNIHGKQRNG